MREGHLEAMCHGGLVGAQAIILVEVAHLAHALLVQLGAVRRLVVRVRVRVSVSVRVRVRARVRVRVRVERGG